MPKYSPATGLRDIRDEVPLTDDQVYRGTNSVFTQGLRSGVAEAGGQLHSLVGQAGEGFGLNDFAASQRAAADASQQEADAIGPRMGNWRDIRSAGDLGTHLAGSFGRMVPAVGAGIAGAFAAPEALLGGALIGATAATAPLTIGAEFQRQQANPEARQQSFADRTMTGIGAGTANAALMNVVPQFMGGKLIGRGVAGASEHAIAQASKKAILAKNLSEGVLGNGLAGAGSEAVNQMADTHYDPNRDTSQDNQRMIDAGIGGAIVGAPFGAVGMAGELAHRGSAVGEGNMFTRLKDKASEALTKDDGSTGIDTTPVTDFASGAYTKMKDMLGGKNEPVDLTAARDIAAGKDPISSINPEVLASAAPEAQQAMVQEATTSRFEQVKKMYADLRENGSLSDESKAALDAAGTDLSSTASQMKVAAIKLAEDGKAKISSAIDSAYQIAHDQYTKLSKDDGKTKSEMGEGIRQVVSDTVMPFLQQHRPEILGSTNDIQRIGDTLRMIAEVTTKADVDMQGVRYLHTIFGERTFREIVTQIHEAIGSDADPVATKNFFKAMGKLQDHEVSTDELTRAVTSAHDKDALKQKIAENPDYVKTMVDGIRSHTDESAYAGMSKPKADSQKTEFNLAMQKEFGSKSKAMLSVFDKHAEQGSAKSQLGREIDDPTQYNEDGHDALSKDDPEYDKTRYFGVGKSETPGLFDSPAAHREKFPNRKLSPAEETLARVRKENPDHNVEMVRHEDLPPEVRANYPDGAGKVLVRAEGMKQEGRMTPEDMDAVRLDTSIASHRESPSRIDTGVRGAVIDARKLVKSYQSEQRTPLNEADNKGDLHRLAHVFMEGIAAAQDHLGKTFVVPDETVVVVKGTKHITWGELKKLEFAPEGKGSSDITEFLHDATHNEMRRELKNLEKIIDSHEQNVKDKISELRESGVYFTTKAIKELRESMETDEIAQARKDAFQVDKAIKESGVVDTTLTEDVGKREVGADDNPHEMRDSAGVGYVAGYSGKGAPEPLSKTEEGMVNRVGLDGQNINHTGFAKNRTKADEMISRDAEIRDRIGKMEKSPVAGMREMAEKLRDLRKLETYKSMSAFDRDRLGAEILLAKKASDLKSTVEALSNKYLEAKTEAPKFAPQEKSQWGGSELKKPRAFGEPVAEGISESRQMPGKTPITPAEKTAVEKMIKGSLGDSVRVEFNKLFHAGDYERVKDSAGLAQDLIRLSMHSLDPMSTGFHEVLHGFIEHMREVDLHGVNSALYKAADSVFVRGKLREFLKNEPEALKQIDGPHSTSEERAAYMYQMWAAGKLELHDAPKNVLQKISDFIKKTLGMWTTNKRAENIMQYLHDGEYAQKGLGDRSAVARALLESGTNKTFETVKQTFAPLVRISDNIISAGDNVLARMDNPAIDKIRKLVNANTNDEGQGTGWISAARIAKTTELNSLMTALGKSNVTAEHMRGALEQLQSGKLAGSPEARLLAHETGPIRQLLDKLHTYAADAGVDLGDRGKGAGYFPVVWDISHIAANQKDFRAMLDKYVRSGKITNPDAIIKTLLSNDGNDFGIETNRPGMESAKKRKLDFISKEDRAEFLQKDLMATMSSYVTQITRRAEWSRRFGDDSAGLNRLLAEAKAKHGATDQQIATVDKFIKGIDGSLGDNIDPGLRRLYGNAIVYQNIRLLPFAVFSMAVDPGGIMVRGGTMKDAFTAFRRGITEIKRGFDKNPSKDEWYQMAETMGVIDNATLVHTLGTSYSQGMVGDTGRKINDTFFRYNLVEQMNTSMRVAAVPAALSFMAKHADGTKEAHSARWLSELDLKPGDVVVKDGKPLTTQAEFESHGMSPTDALAAENRMHLAVNKWVDGAILRPNAAHKPGWMNDPHYALVAHLKQFVYSFNETIIKRVVNEAKYGNYTPAYALASYIPTMMAADFIKGMIVGGGSQPSYKDDWGTADYVGSGFQRAGLLMHAQFGLDAYKNLKMGGTGVQALLGPQIEQLADGIKTLGGHESGSSFALDAAPISPIVKAISHSGSSKADPNFSD